MMSGSGSGAVSGGDVEDEIRKLSFRLDDSTSAERLEALGDQSPYARTHPKQISSIALNKILNFGSFQGPYVS